VAGTMGLSARFQSQNESLGAAMKGGMDAENSAHSAAGSGEAASKGKKKSKWDQPA
jgi:hypothetical protein